MSGRYSEDKSLTYRWLSISPLIFLVPYKGKPHN